MGEIEYSFSEIEKKWQKRWDDEKVFVASIDDKKKKYYLLEMFPYPSGRLHMGHVRNYSIGDLMARYKRMKGLNVLHPIGWDAFGLPAENAAIKSNIPPLQWTEDNISYMKSQFKKLGVSYDWAREISTHHRDYYRWNQWVFCRMFEKGLAYKKKASVNWCPSCNTVLANEQVENGLCWRCDSSVTQKELEQWFFRITQYADDLLNGHEILKDGWPERVITMQRNWIGKSTGLMINFMLESGEDFPIYTTRPDTVYGVTFMVIAPEHPLLDRVKDPEVRSFINRFKSQSLVDRLSEEKEKEGINTGISIINPFNGDKVPLFVGNFVLMEYGTGAIMAVPAHDTRDFAFAKKYGVPVTLVIDNPVTPIIVSEMQDAYVDEGICVNSSDFTGIPNRDAMDKISDYAEKKGFGKRTVTYRLRDWLISRQRYWGCPIPVVYCDHCGTQLVRDDDLPVVLPTQVEFHGDSRSPLTQMEDFYKTKCPSCGGPARRETDTMDTFVDSSWYFAKFTSPRSKGMFDENEVKYWMPVDQYIGGIEHACMHLLYARFYEMVLKDFGLLVNKEPFTRLLTQGMVIKDGAKMSKSKGNIVDPDNIIATYGADTARLFMLFASPPDKDLDWSDKGVEGCFRFISRVWRIVNRYSALYVRDVDSSIVDLSDALKSFRIELHRTVKIVSNDIEERMQYNTAIARMMELVNGLYQLREEELGTPGGRIVLSEAFNKLLAMLSPFIPHVTEELWSLLGHKDMLVNASWPEYIESLTVRDAVEIVFQVNGKIRAKAQVASDISEEEMKKMALEDPKVKDNVTGHEIRKVIVVPGKLVNVVVK